MKVHEFKLGPARDRNSPPSNGFGGSSTERGYTLVALLAVMSLIALFALEAAPTVRQQAQREREKEAIFRGQQVADAIRSYYGAH